MARFILIIFVFLIKYGDVLCQPRNGDSVELAEQLDQYCDWRSNTLPPKDQSGQSRRMTNVTVGLAVVEKLINNSLAFSGSLCEMKLAELTKTVKNLQRELSKRTRRSCKDVTIQDAKVWRGNGGIFDIYPSGDIDKPMEVFCDLSDGAGWTVIQRRMDGSESFERYYADYVNGFGKISGEFWLGLENLHELTYNARNELKVESTDWEGNEVYAIYKFFRVGSAYSQYSLTITGYSGTAGDSFADHNGRFFATVDRDYQSCAQRYRGGWWFYYGGCADIHLNGIYIDDGEYKYDHYPFGIEWYGARGAHGHSLKKTTMKIRPVSDA